MRSVKIPTILKISGLFVLVIIQLKSFKGIDFIYTSPSDWSIIDNTILSNDNTTTSKNKTDLVDVDNKKAENNLVQLPSFVIIGVMKGVSIFALELVTMHKIITDSTTSVLVRVLMHSEHI